MKTDLPLSEYHWGISLVTLLSIDYAVRTKEVYLRINPRFTSDLEAGINSVDVAEFWHSPWWMYHSNSFLYVLTAESTFLAEAMLLQSLLQEKVAVNVVRFNLF